MCNYHVMSTQINSMNCVCKLPRSQALPKNGGGEPGNEANYTERGEHLGTTLVCNYSVMSDKFNELCV